MKKLILSITLAGVTFGLSAASVSLTIPPGAYTNLLTVSGITKVTSIIITPTSNTTVLAFVDAPTNKLTYVNPVYTNTVSYVSNWNFVSYTNYFGLVVTNLTNYVLVDVSTNLVGPTTNSYPVRFIGSATAPNSVSASGVNYYFNSGVWVTNQSTNTGIATISYQQ